MRTPKYCDLNKILAMLIQSLTLKQTIFFDEKLNNL